MGRLSAGIVQLGEPGGDAISRQRRSFLARVGDAAVYARSYIWRPSPREHVLRAYFTLAVLFVLGGIFWASLIYFLFP